MLRDYSWTTKPVCEIVNPSSQNYCGKCLVEDAKDKFFSSTFKPKSNYRSAPIFLVSNKPYDDSIVERLTDVGFTTLQSIRAASLLNDFEQSVTFLQTGQYAQNSPFPIPLSYYDCPLLYEVHRHFLKKSTKTRRWPICSSQFFHSSSRRSTSIRNRRCRPNERLKTSLKRCQRCVRLENAATIEKSSKKSDKRRSTF